MYIKWSLTPDKGMFQYEDSVIQKTNNTFNDTLNTI